MVRAKSKLSVADLEKESDRLVENGLVLYPRGPAVNAAESLVDGAEEAYKIAMGHALLVRHLAGKLKRRRSLGRRDERIGKFADAEIRQLLDVIPLQIPTGKGRTVEFEKATQAHWGRYRKILVHEHAEGRKKDQRIAAVETIMERMAPHVKGARQITLFEVVSLEAEKKGPTK